MTRAYGDGGPPSGSADDHTDQPPWNDGSWPQDRPSAWSRDQGAPGPNGQRPGPQGQRAQNQGQGYAAGYGTPDYGTADYGRPGYGNAGYGPAPSFQPHAAAGNPPQPGYPGPGAQYDPQYDQRGTGSPRTAGGNGNGYPAPARDDSFVPGFGPGDDTDQGHGRGRRARGGRYPDDAGYAPDDAGPRNAGPGNADPRRGAGVPNDRGPDPLGWDDQRRDRDNWDLKNNRPRKKATRWAPRILLLVFFGAILIGAGIGAHYVYGKYEAKYHPADYVGAGIKPTVTVQVASGETATGLAPTLVKLGVVASERAFTNAVEASSNPTGLEAGFFTLNHHMQASLAWSALLNPKNRVQLGVTIPEGKRVSQVILILAKETKIPVKNFQQVIDHPAKLDLPSYAKGKVEGYLFPATYAIEPHETALAILQAMVTRFKVEAAQIDLPVAAKRIGLSATQVIIEASMAQAEGGSVSDYPKIARVISNRLKDGMHLQFDSVLLYGLHKYAINVTDKQIATKGPYNDFEHAGLPPGSISNPGDAAIKGILHPATGDWLYFLTNSGGKSTFSATPLQGQ